MKSILHGVDEFGQNKTQGKKMNINTILNTIERHISKDRLLENVETIQAIDKYFTMPKFMESSKVIAKHFEECGLEAEVLEFPADGATRMGDWTMPLAWDCTSAKLTITSPYSEILCDREAVAQCVGMWSAPTDENGIAAEIVGPLFQDSNGNLLLETQEGNRAVSDEEIEGRFLFTTQPPRSIRSHAIRVKAAAIITSTMHRNKPLHDATAWINNWADRADRWAFTKQDTPVSCFVITPNKGKALTKKLHEGTVEAHGVINSRLYEGILPVATGLIRGETDEEILMLGHGFEIGANDNATGVAAIMESAEVLAKLIREGVIPRPRVGVRFLVMSECYGTMAYALSNPERMKKTLSALNLDSIGVYQHKTNMIMPLTYSPNSNPSLGDALAYDMFSSYITKRDPYFAWQEHSFAPNDSSISDPIIDTPTVYLGGQDDFWHTTSDTLENIDTHIFSTMVAASASWVYALANGSSTVVRELATLAARFGQRSVINIATEFENALKTNNELNIALDSLSHVAKVAHNRCDSAKAFTPNIDKELENTLTQAHELIDMQTNIECDRLRAICPNAIKTEKPEWWEEASSIVVERLVPGVINLDDVSPEEIGSFAGKTWDAIFTNILFRCDNNRTLAEAIHLGTMDSNAYSNLGSIPSYIKFIRFAETQGLVKIHKRKIV